MVLIFIDALSVGIQGELPTADNVTLMVVKLLFNFIDSFTMVIFCVEILLKWMNNFVSFWKTGWNVFDFVITVLVSTCDYFDYPSMYSNYPVINKL